MPLKFKVSKLEDVVDEAIRKFYKETPVGDEGEKVFVLDVEGAVAAERVTDLTKKVNTFRTTNTRLAERMKVMAEFAGIELEEDITPEDLANILKDKAEETKKQLEKLGQGGAAEVEKQVAARVEAMKTTHETERKKLLDKVAKSDAEKASYLSQLDKLSITSAVIETATKRGLKPTAHRDIISRAREVFKFVDGKVRAFGEDGETSRYGADGVTELTISEWVETEASKDGSHLFEGNAGSGAAGSGGAGGGNDGLNGKNPWSKDTWDTTAQMVLLKKDPTRARRLANEAGRSIPAPAGT